MKILWQGLVLLLVPAVATAQFLDSRNRAMGGVGVASSRYTAAGFINPALLTVYSSSDNFGFILPSGGIGAADEDGLIQGIEDLQDQIDVVRQKISDLTITQADRDSLADSLQALDGRRAAVDLSAGLSVAFPSKDLAWAIVISSVLEGQVTPIIDPADIATIRSPSLSLFDLDNLRSEGRVLGTGITEFGVALATELRVGGFGLLSVGATPKVQRLETFNYSLNINTFDSDDFDDSSHRTDSTKFNIDVGAALNPIKGLTIGLAARNLITHELDTVAAGPGGTIATLSVEPQVTLGVAASFAGLTVAADIDLVEIERYKDIGTLIDDNSQFARLGLEYSMLGWMQLRLGVQYDFERTVSNVYTGGLGLSPFDVVHFDIAGLYGEGDTYGVMAQLWFTF